ncbi:MAG: paraslipin [Candidatus Schekmanbacteria bacterium]|nr:paraslipin [Candidatus Schekmanbacteria bacterium]
MWPILLVPWTILILYLVLKVSKSFAIVPTQRAWIVERLGKYHETLQPGFHLVWPFFYRVAYKLDLREEAIEVPPQDCFTKDNVKVVVDGIIYVSVVNPVNASYGVTNYRFAAVQLAQTTTRSVIGTLELDRSFEERDEISSRVVQALAEVGAGWGIRVHRYEIKNIVPPPSVRESMERQMAAERDRRALLAKSEGERQSRINESLGLKTELINRSEGEMQRRINEAEGRAAEILSIAKATAESIEKIASALSVEGGEEAIRLRLSQKLIGELGALAGRDKSIIMATDITRIDDLLASMGLTLPGSVHAGPPRRRMPVPAPQPPAPPQAEGETARMTRPLGPPPVRRPTD